MARNLLLATGWVVLAACSGTTAAAPVSHPSSSPTPDAVTRVYVALVHAYWADLQAADGISGGVNVAAQSCLGSGGPVDPPTCRGRAVALVAVQRKFSSNLNLVVVPRRFADEDSALRKKLPAVIADLEALIAACDTGNKDSVVAAAGSYVDDMIPAVTSALDTIDPTVVHQ